MKLTRGTWLPLITLAALGVAACQPAESDAPPEDAAEAPAQPAVIEVTLEDFAFVAPPQLRSGWTTFRMTNTGEESHFMLLWRLPEGTTFGDYAEQVTRPFQEEYDRYTSGELSQAEMLERVGGRLPEWFGAMQGMGGVGLTAPGRTAQATVLLEPGNYAMECYAVADDGQFHGTLGMLRPLIVTSEATGMEAPQADIQITLSNYEMSVVGELTAGEHTIAVHTTEDPEGLVGHDVHLARLDPDTSIDDVIAWLSWIDGMRPEAPAEFLGGAEHVSAGRTGYFTATLEPGRHVLISEGFAGAGMVKEFVVE